MIIVGIVIICLIIGGIFLFGIPKKIEEKEGGTTYKQEGLITESLYFDDSDMDGKIMKNKLTKTATVEINQYIDDETEYMDFLGEKVTGVPFIVNIGCGLFGLAFFNQSALADLQEEGNMTSEDNQQISLEDYTVKSASIIFLDKETNEKIAECTSTGPTWDDINFKAYRDYSDVGSFFGAEIGKPIEIEE